MRIHSRADHWYVCVCLCVGHLTPIWTVCLQRKGADNQEVHPQSEIHRKLLHCAPPTDFGSDDVMHHKLSACLSLSLLRFTTHATTSHLRNGVGNCVTVTVLIHHVCV